MSEIYDSTEHQLQQNQQHLSALEILAESALQQQPVYPLAKCIHVPVIQIAPKAGKSSSSMSPAATATTSYNISNDIIEISDDSSDLIFVNETPPSDKRPDIIAGKNKKTVGPSDHGDKEKDETPLKDHSSDQTQLPSYNESTLISGPHGLWFFDHNHSTQLLYNDIYETHFLSDDSSLQAGASTISEQQSEVHESSEHNNNCTQPVMHQNNYASPDESSRQTIYENQLQNNQILLFPTMYNEVHRPMRRKKKTASKTKRSVPTVPEQDNTINTIEGSSGFPCPICPKKYDRKRSLAMHRRVHKRSMPEERPIDEGKST